MNHGHPFTSKRIIIIGGAGFVGSNLAKKILELATPASLIIIDNLLSAERENLPKHAAVQFIEGSITNDEILNRIEDDVDYIFHLATYHGNQSSIHDPLADHENNTLTTLKLFNHLKIFKNLTKVVYSSAGCSVAEKTFGTAHATTENDPISINQDSPYSISKIIGEFYSVYFNNRHGLPVVRARFQNVYGPGEVLGAGIWRGTPATVWRNVTPTFIFKALKGLQLPVENEGLATRDFIYVEDICKGLIACATNGMAGDVYNIGSGKETSILTLAKTIIELAGSKSEIVFLPKRTWDNSGKRFASTEKAQKELKFKAEVELRDGLKQTVAWTRLNTNLINRCIKKHQKFMESV